MNDIPGYEGLYAATEDGRIWSYPKSYSSRYGKWLKQTANPRGYLMVGLYKNRRAKRWTVHRLVALTYIPSLDGKPQLNHKDGNKTNNTVGNLEWCTNRENYLHADKLGLIKQYTERQILIRQENGRRTGPMNSMRYLRIFTMEKAEQIREWYRQGKSCRAIGRSLGCSDKTIGKIVNGLSYTISI
jgi:DNA-binding CsgD family transcriptional regulator